MDGVLIDSEQAHFESWGALAGELGCSVTHADFLKTFGRQNRDAIPMLFGITEAARIRELSERKEWLYRERIRGRVPAYADAAPLVRACHAAGFKLAVGSSGHPENVKLAIDEMKIADCFSTVVTGNDVTRGKPDPQVFLLAAERLGVPPRSCVVIEDAPAGIDAALAASMKAVAVTTCHPPDKLTHAHRLVDHLGQLTPDALRQLMASL
jgi:beta-phosphoglucomutase